MNQRLLIIFILGFSSGLPMALISSTLQAWFAYSGMSVLATGALSLISLPYAYRIFWGPIVDRYPLLKLGKRRSWILVMQVLLLLGFNLMAWFTPEHYPKSMAFLALILACFSATQDVAIDAHRAEYLSPQQYALGASLAIFGYRLALLISGGLALVMAAHLGWAFTYRFMGFCMFLGMLAVFFSQEPSVEIKEKSSFIASFIAPVKELFLRPGIIFLLFFIFCYKIGEAFTASYSGIVMPFLIQGLGFSLETIGYINKILGVIAVLLGGLTAGIVLIRYSLFRSLLCFGLLQSLANIFFVILALHGQSIPLLAIAVFLDNFASGLGTTALVSLLMRVVNKKYTGTQFSILIAFSTLPRIFSGPIGAKIQMSIGWVGLYELSIGLALLFIPFLIKIKGLIEESDYQEIEKRAARCPSTSSLHT